MTTDSEFLDGLGVGAAVGKNTTGCTGTTATGSTSKPAQLPWTPFPTDVFPEPIRGYVKAGARAMRCDEAYIGVPMLGGLAASIGATHRAMLKPGWHEPSVVWCSVVAESGTMKSPSQSLALDPLRRAQEWQLEQLPRLLEEYERDKALFDADMAAWKRKGRAKGEPPPEKPVEPTVDRYIVNDITVEALAEILADNPRGVLAACDELGAWLGGFDQYRAGRGSDVAKWLSIHRAEGLIVDRKTGAKKTIFVKRAAVSVVGSIQPRTLSRALGDEHFENGLAARLLLASPPRMPKQWSDAAIDHDTYKAVERVYGRLLALNFGTDDNDEAAPVDLPLSADAKAAWIQFYNEHAVAMSGMTGKLAAAMAKLEAYAARLALVMFLVKSVADDVMVHDDAVVEIDGDSMAAGMTLGRWFGAEGERVYRIIDESDEDRERNQLVEIIQKKGGAVTVREIQRTCRRFRDDATLAEAALEGLAKAGFGVWAYRPAGAAGGRPTRVFRLAQDGDGDRFYGGSNRRLA